MSLYVPWVRPAAVPEARDDDDTPAPAGVRTYVSARGAPIDSTLTCAGGCGARMAVVMPDGRPVSPLVEWTCPQCQGAGGQ